MNDRTVPTKTDFILERLDRSIRYSQTSSSWYRNVYFATSIATLTLSVLITIVAGWKPPPFDVDVANVVLVLGALITVISGWGLFFSPKNSWLIYALYLNRLRALKLKMEFAKLSPHIEADEKFALESYAEYQAILDAQNKAWLDLRSTTEPTSQTRETTGSPNPGSSPPPIN